MPADDKVETCGGKRQLLGVALLEADRDAARRRLAPRLGEHRRGKVDAGHAMAAGRELKAQKPGAAASVERVERTPPRRHQANDAVPSGAFGRGADAVP